MKLSLLQCGWFEDALVRQGGREGAGCGECLSDYQRWPAASQQQCLVWFGVSSQGLLVTRHRLRKLNSRQLTEPRSQLEHVTIVMLDTTNSEKQNTKVFLQTPNMTFRQFSLGSSLQLTHASCVTQEWPVRN